ncbi:hypothetical protein TrLO_g8412 [Triparma laevis f. longispina]|uniref:Uncharacterized protein n=1 Tax=Triparma laevis f. longispina TaxID=1714387 RepID=A0A9W7AJ64_9STRA|nr:hypothetical protein TrLO_g8412 [Triparma laevis f. longispina]
MEDTTGIINFAIVVGGGEGGEIIKWCYQRLKENEEARCLSFYVNEGGLGEVDLEGRMKEVLKVGWEVAREGGRFGEAKDAAVEMLTLDLDDKSKIIWKFKLLSSYLSLNNINQSKLILSELKTLISHDNLKEMEGLKAMEFELNLRSNSITSITPSPPLPNLKTSQKINHALSHFPTSPKTTIKMLESLPQTHFMVKWNLVVALLKVGGSNGKVCKIWCEVRGLGSVWRGKSSAAHV